MPSEQVLHREIVGLQRAEFAKASCWQTAILFIQGGIAAVAVGSAFSPPNITYALTLTALVLAAAWQFAHYKLKASRAQAERARRSTLLMDGLGEQISEAELRDIRRSFTVSLEQGRIHEDGAYYDAKAGAGESRLAEMLEESAFWSHDLLEKSATVMIGFFLASLAAAVFLLLAIVFIFDGAVLQKSARAVCAAITLFVSAEVFGAAVAFASAARCVERVNLRLTALRGSGARRADLLQIMGDYNSAVEGAPLFVPGVYRRNRERLNQLWKERIPMDSDPRDVS